MVVHFAAERNQTDWVSPLTAVLQRKLFMISDGRSLLKLERGKKELMACILTRAIS